MLGNSSIHKKPSCDKCIKPCILAKNIGVNSFQNMENTSQHSHGDALQSVMGELGTPPVLDAEDVTSHNGMATVSWISDFKASFSLENTFKIMKSMTIMHGQS